ncbi:MAG TPA: hypothetical protein DEA08_16200, partial [Planctomycetes bacterium]|nr:hypothetical protein [Planctomycetota bacterium]
MRPPATTLGPYRLLQRLGQGGMGAVYLAEHTQTRARYALKLLSSALGEEELARFEREAQAMAAVDGHPYLVRVHGCGREGRHRFLVQQLVEGRDLASALAEGGPLPPAEAAALVAQVARGVSHAHGRGVLHRDLKPANVLLDRRGQPKVSDFGLAFVAGATTLTRTGEVLGTPVYMAPEQARAEACDERTDVYGLGALLYACLTGQAPIAGRGSVLATLAAVDEEAPAPPSTLAPGVPPWLDELCLRALDKEPAQRFPSAQALAEALERRGAVAGGRSLAPTFAALGALVGAGLLGVLWGSAQEGAPQASPRSTPALPARSTPAPPQRGPGLLRAGDPELVGLRASELFARLEATLAAAEAEGDEELALEARLELLRACLRRCHYDRAEARGRPLFVAPAYRAEARYLCGLAAVLDERGADALRHLEQAASEPGFWGALAQVELAARRARGSKPEALRVRVEELLTLATGLGEVYAERLRLHLSHVLDARRLRELHERYSDDAALAVGLAEIDFRDPSRSARDLLSLLERARFLAAPREPPNYRSLRAGAEALAGNIDAALPLLEPPGASVSRQRLQLQLGVELEALGRPLAAQRVWRGLGPSLSGGAARAFSQAPEALRQRVGRAMGVPLGGVRFGPGFAASLAGWVAELPPGLREQAASVVRLAMEGYTWRYLEERIEALGRVHEGPAYELLAAELALGRSAEGAAAHHVTRALALGADPVRCFVLGSSEAPPLPRDEGAAHTLGQACVQLRQGQSQAALDLLRPALPANSPDWTRRARWMLIVMASDCLPEQLAQDWSAKAFDELGLSQALVPFLSGRRRLLARIRESAPEAELRSHFTKLAALLRLEEGALTRIDLAAISTLLPPS